MRPPRVLALALLLPLAACPQQVSVPGADTDVAPVITVNAFEVGGSGTVNQENVSSPGPALVQATLGSEIMLSAHAHNPGGVKDLTITLVHGNTSISASTSSTPDESGKVPDQLDILGSDGGGKAGSTPIMLLETPVQSSTPLPATVTVSATNYNGMKTSFVVTYEPHWLLPSIAFSASATYINIGTAAKLTWQIQNCSAFCAVRVEGRDGLGFNDLVEAQPNLPAYGSLDARPMRSTDTRYTITATNPLGSVATKDVTITLAPSTATPKGQVFYFRMDGTSPVTPCFTAAIYAPDQSTATTWIENQNGGYSASSIDAAAYLAGC